MRKLSFTILLVLASISISAFAADLSKYQAKEFKSLTKKANKLFENTIGDKYQANVIYLQAYKIDSTNTELLNKIGDCYLSGSTKLNSTAYFEKSIAIDSSYNNAYAYYRLATAYQLNNEFNKALKLYDKYLILIPQTEKGKKLKALQAHAKLRIEQCLVGNQIFEHPNNNVHIINLEDLNTKNDEYNTILLNEKNGVIYSSASIDDNEREECIMFAENQGDNKFNKPYKYITKSKSHNLAISAVNDGQIYVYDGNKPYEVNIYVFKGGKWFKEDDIKFNKKSGVRKISFSSDGKTVYFASEDKNSIGGQDIYFSTQNEKGKWSKAQNIGTAINTQYNETAPTILNDTILYFASQGNNSMGGYDIFYSIFKDGKWSTAQNLGSPINTSYDEVFYTPVTTNTAYISSNRNGGKGETDIYYATTIIEKPLAENFDSPSTNISASLLGKVDASKTAEIDSARITVLKGSIMNQKGEPLSAKITLIDNNLGQVIAEFSSDTLGYYSVKLPGGINYGVSVGGLKGYLFHSENIDLPEQTKYQEIEKNIVLKDIAVGNNIILNNIFFDSGKATLNDMSISELNILIKLLNDNPTINIEVSGHTDNTGSLAINNKISQQRADAVKNYLIKNGIDKARLTAKGYAYSKSIASNKTAEGRKQNRRTEFMVTKL